MNQSQYKINSPMGDLYLVATEKGLSGIYFKNPRFNSIQKLTVKTPQEKILKQAEAELADYFKGKKTTFKVKLDLHGTEFQKKVWNQLLKIPFGKTKSYREVAEKLQTKSYRAVGSANGKNPLCIIIPCHRVISANGTLGGYSGGLDNKRKLHAIENIAVCD